MAKNSIFNRFDYIKKISLFANFSENDLREILKNSQIFEFKKGKILFSQGEKILNFYIVLDGVVKLTISDTEGEEAVLQIANSGQMIIDSFGKNFQTNAHVVKNSLLLLIPAKQIENQIQKNLLLANNFFNEIAAQNKNLINQLVQLKLGNSKQKLGQFLLGISFEKGATKSKNFSLKCDKSVVASYLGMKPETFSRALQKLKIDGEIEVKKNEIILQHEKSLCNYCNEEIATKCGHKKHLSCDLSFTDI